MSNEALPKVMKEYTRNITVYLFEDEQGNAFAGEGTNSLTIHGERDLAKYRAKQAQELFYKRVGTMKPSEVRSLSSTMSIDGLRSEFFLTRENTMRRAWILPKAKQRS